MSDHRKLGPNLHLNYVQGAKSPDAPKSEEGLLMRVNGYVKYAQGSLRGTHSSLMQRIVHCNHELNLSLESNQSSHAFPTFPSRENGYRCSIRDE